MQKKHSWPWLLLLLVVVSGGGLGYMLSFLPPQKSITVANFSLPYIPFFFVGLFLFVYSLCGFILRSGKQGILLACGVVIFFLLQLYNIRNIFFTILLFILVICAEGVIWKKNN